MQWNPVDRAAGAFQQSVSADQMLAMAARALGPGAVVRRADEIGVGTYNSVYRLTLDDGTAVILRVAPAPNAIDPPGALRNEWAVAPFLASLVPLVPRALGADFTHDIVDRDWMIATVVPGVPAQDRFDGYDAAARGEYFH